MSLRNMPSPLYLLGLPLLVLVSIPLAFFAIVTTSIAVSTLAARVSIVYFELGIALIQSYFFAPPPKQDHKIHSSRRASPHRARRRRSSVASTASSTETAVPGAHTKGLRHKSDSFASLIGSADLNRDFEGVGGWRVSGNDEEEALWMGMNSRLELPAVMPKRKHQRSLTSGSMGSAQRWSWSPEAMRMSPMQSRARTPNQSISTSGRASPEDYFGGHLNARPYSTVSESAAKGSQDWRRKSSSSSSAGSRRASAIKHPGE